MNAATRGLVLAGLAVLMAVPTAAAQQPYSPRPNLPPAYSPYLNLLRRGNSPAINYYGLVRPELEFRSSINNLSQQIGAVGQDLQSAVDGTSPLVTGHSVSFQNTRGYFGSTGGAGRPARTVTGGGAGAISSPTAGVGLGLIAGGGTSGGGARPAPSGGSRGRR